VGVHTKKSGKELSSRVRARAERKAVVYGGQFTLSLEARTKWRCDGQDMMGNIVERSNETGS
jgi:hypothetical protein